MQVIVGDGMKGALINPPGIIPVNHLAHKPEVRPDLPCRLSQSLHVPEIQHIGSIQPDAVDLKLLCPEPNHITDIIPHRRIILVQFHQKVISPPVFIGESVVVLIIPPKIHTAVPILVRGILPVLFDVLKGKKISSRVIKYPV